MSGNRDAVTVSSSGLLRPGSASGGKGSMGYNLAKLSGCTSTIFSSSVKKGPNTYGRNARSSMTETVFLATNGSKKGLIGGQVAAKRVVSSSLVKGILNTHDEELLVETDNLDEEMKKLEGCPLFANGVDRRLVDSSAEKVSKWLEESENSAVTDLVDMSVLDCNEEEMSRYRQHEESAWFTSSKETFGEVHDYYDGKRPAQIPRNGSLLPQDSTKIPLIPDSKIMCPFRFLMRYVKIIMCLWIVIAGLCIRTIPTSWESLEPPPT